MSKHWASSRQDLVDRYLSEINGLPDGDSYSLTDLLDDLEQLTKAALESSDRALIETWRTRARDYLRLGDFDQRVSVMTIRRCADELEALLPVPPQVHP